MSDKPILAEVVRAKVKKNKSGAWMDIYKCPACGAESAKTACVAKRSPLCQPCGMAWRKSHGMSGDPIYNAWKHMVRRCTNPATKDYHRYGGRGISVCPEWMDFETFKLWAFSSGHARGLQIDRINNDGNYGPSNCRWVTASVNVRNRSSTKLTAGDVRAIRMLCWSNVRPNEVGKIFGVSHQTVSKIMAFEIWGDV